MDCEASDAARVCSAAEFAAAAARGVAHQPRAWTLVGRWVTNEHVRALPRHTRALVLDAHPFVDDDAGDAVRSYEDKLLSLQYGALQHLAELTFLRLRGIRLRRTRAHPLLPRLRRVEVDADMNDLTRAHWSAQACAIHDVPSPVCGGHGAAALRLMLQACFVPADLDDPWRACGFTASRAHEFLTHAGWVPTEEAAQPRAAPWASWCALLESLTLEDVLQVHVGIQRDGGGDDHKFAVARVGDRAWLVLDSYKEHRPVQVHVVGRAWAGDLDAAACPANQVLMNSDGYVGEWMLGGEAPLSVACVAWLRAWWLLPPQHGTKRFDGAGYVRDYFGLDSRPRSLLRWTRAPHADHVRTQATTA